MDIILSGKTYSSKPSNKWNRNSRTSKPSGWTQRHNLALASRREWRRLACVGKGTTLVVQTCSLSLTSSGEEGLPPHFCNPFESATYGDLLCICLTTHGLSTKGILRPHAVENRSKTRRKSRS